MQHVADGIMHAYIDGALDALADAGELPGGVTGADVRAHFDACADCRARLDDARAVKERAGLILSDAGRDVVDVPPFDMIGGRSHARRRLTWLPLAWAASLVLAIGAGWWASDIARDDRVTVAGEVTRQAESTAAAPSTVAAADDREPADGSTTEPERDGPTVGAATADALETEAVPVAPVADALATTPAVASASMADMETGPAAHPDADAFRAQVAAARADTSAWWRIDGPATGAVGGQRAVLVVAGAGAAVYDVTAPTIGLGELVRARQWLETGEQIEVIAARPQRVALSEIIVTGAGKPPADARSLAARPPTAPSREAGAAGAAADGRARVDVVSSELLGDGLAEVTVWLPDEGIWVSIRGALPVAELAGLARRLARPNGS